jgi:hypothetical protein
MLDLVICSLLTINPKLYVTLLNFIEPDKVTLGQDFEGFRLTGEAQTLKKDDIAL